MKNLKNNTKVPKIYELFVSVQQIWNYLRTV